MRQFLISTLLFCGVGLAVVWGVLNWHKTASPVSVLEEAYYCYRKQDAPCINQLVDGDAVVANFLAESETSALKATGGKVDGFHQFTAKLGMGMLHTMKPMLKITLENALAQTVKDESIQQAVNEISPWQAKLFTLYPHTKNFDVNTTELNPNEFKLTIQREAGSSPLNFTVERQASKWKITSIPINDLGH